MFVFGVFLIDGDQQQSDSDWVNNLSKADGGSRKNKLFGQFLLKNFPQGSVCLT